MAFPECEVAGQRIAQGHRYEHDYADSHKHPCLGEIGKRLPDGTCDEWDETCDDVSAAPHERCKIAGHSRIVGVIDRNDDR